jgi:hypothetical protein
MSSHGEDALKGLHSSDVVDAGSSGKPPSSEASTSGEVEGAGSMEKSFIEGVKKLVGSRPRQSERTEFYA